MRIRSIAAALGVAVVAPAMLAACGTSDPGTAGNDAPAANASAECADDTTATSTEPVEVTDALGRTVSLDAPAKRVAVLEWQQIEDVLTLCLTPVAVADAEGYRTWDTAETLPDGVADVGGRGEPNLDALFAADPDLVIVEATAVDDPVITQLAEYDIPVLATRGADTADPVQNMVDTFVLIAESVGRAERADAVVADFRASVDDARQAITEADLPQTDFVYFDGWVQGGNVAIRPFGQGSLIGELGEAVGLTNAWTGEVDAVYGLGQTDVEGMTTVGDALLFHTGTVDSAGGVMTELQRNDIWNSLPAVAEERAYAFPAGIWTFGGPRSSQQVLDAYVDILTN
ncbi:iron-siderophore ABC transporter substrate-binding protein [Micromonospora sp. NBC_01813]|uniref:iron-siderophore ABC transporter substrate-binding protein n=1 Tax=Micromonospora sp. NBC_01813 TaxID=2975988 RepID=UPI002DD9CFDB|nr:iron-siderophore ABC transporter substrate-binding protein [Micromonospora sp. NBC_01813]WSA10142.1 iron-siderophore ABC transporter substrate-binding protein [Micromonospora sp. NBC_01813]